MTTSATKQLQQYMTVSQRDMKICGGKSFSITSIRKTLNQRSEELEQQHLGFLINMITVFQIACGEILRIKEKKQELEDQKRELDVINAVLREAYKKMMTVLVENTHEKKDPADDERSLESVRKLSDTAYAA